MTSKHAQAPVLISQGVFDSVKTFRDFEQKVSDLGEVNTKAQGDAFEIFVEAYLATQPILQCQETWLVGDIPVEIREALNLPNDSKGIDGVYKSMLDDYVPYQVKFRSNRPALGFNEVAPFLGITEKATDRLLITNCDTIAIDVQNRAGIRSLRGVDFDQLTDEDFTVIENWLKQNPKKRQPLTPDPYQVEALTNIADHLRAHDRGTVVMACGTGKTLVALWAVEQSKAKSILVLVPSLTLLQQTLEEWSVHNAWGKDFSYLCVCSDPSVNLKNDAIEIDPSDVPFRIDTDPQVVRRYLAQANGKTKIVFSTYQSSQVVSQATKGNFKFDIAIFDEAHKTTGSVEGRFALALKDENIKIAKRLFLTATPKHYDISKRDKDGEFKFVSMDDEAVYGKRAYTLTFGDAAAKGIICPYKVVITLINKQQVDDFSLKNGITLVEGDSVKAKWVASQIAVSSAIKHTNATKIITFHSRVKTAREFASDEAYGIKKFVDDFEVFHVQGKQKSNERKDSISKFRKASRSIITNAKCLTEGVDVPAVDMVAFVDPRHSKIDIAQAVGRAMRKPRGGNKTVGYIVVPIFAEDASDQSLDRAIKSQDFDDVALILNSLLEQDEELVEIIQELKQAKGRGEVFNPKRFKEKIEVIGPLIGLDELTNSICVEAVDRLGESWDKWFGCLEKYVGIYGDCLVPLRFKFENKFNLGYWVSDQRRYKDKLSINKLILLESLAGWSWDPKEDDWQLGFKNLKKYNEEYGDCLVPNKYISKNKFTLGTWVATQRSYRNNITEQRKKLLESLVGWSWDPNADKWQLGLSILKEYYKINGDCLVPSSYKSKNGYLLGRWVSHQRMDKDNLSDDKKTLLESLGGWSWDPNEDSWNLGFKNLKKYNEEYGDCLVPNKYISKNKFKLGFWVSRQKRNKDNLSEEKKLLLESLDYWDPNEDSWNLGFKNLKKYNEEYGDCLVPNKYISKNKFKLGFWVSRQRKSKDNLSEEKKLLLESLDCWVWDIYENMWNLGFNCLKRYCDENGDCRVPKDFITSDNFKLANWIGTQRKNRGTLSKDKENLLESLNGWSWDPREEFWQLGFMHLKNYSKANGNCSVPSTYISSNNFNLGIWVATQKKYIDKIPEGRKKLLESLTGWSEVVKKVKQL
jgi:superfamily II DNA or RNA helicase